MKFSAPVLTRFIKDGRRLLTAAPDSYLILVKGTIGVGALMLFCYLASLTQGPILGQPASWFLTFGTMVLAAGLFAAWLLDFAEFDLREKTYRRRCGSWPGRRLYKGRLSDLHAIVVTYEPSGTLIPVNNTFVVRAHWKAQNELPTKMLSLMQQGFANGSFDGRYIPHLPPEYISAMDAAMKFASALGLPLYNSTGLPVPPVAQAQPFQGAPGQNWGARP